MKRSDEFPRTLNGSKSVFMCYEQFPTKIFCCKCRNILSQGDKNYFLSGTEYPRVGSEAFHSKTHCNSKMHPRHCARCFRRARRLGLAARHLDAVEWHSRVRISDCVLVTHYAISLGARTCAICGISFEKRIADS